MAGPSPSPEPKQPLTIVTSSFQEFTPETSSSRPRATMAQHANTAFIAISAILGLAIMATSANALQVFHSTHLGAEFRLPVWPQSFDLKPTIAGIVCGVIVFVMNSVALVGQFVPALKRNSLALPTLIPLAIALLAAVVASAIPFNALTSSTKWTVQTWSCQWSNISTSTSPHWGTLCSESRAAGIMSICVIPFDVLAVASVIASVMKAKRNVQPVGQWERKGSAGEMS